MRFTWVGGPTFLLELGAFRVLADPVFSESFMSASGEQVSRAVSIPDIQIPAVDVLALSCNRADHFDPDALQRIPSIGTALFPRAHGGGFPALSTDDRRGLRWFEQTGIEKHNETLEITATPASDEGNGYFFEHIAGDKKFAAYWTADARWSNDVRELQRKHGHANLLVQHLGAETGTNGEAISPDGKDAMQFVYRMQPNAVVAVHHNTFGHYNETIEPFRELISRTIYEKRLRVLAEGESFEKA